MRYPSLIIPTAFSAIEATFDCWNHLGECGFMEKMWVYCTQQLKVRRSRTSGAQVEPSHDIWLPTF